MLHKIGGYHHIFKYFKISKCSSVSHARNKLNSLMSQLIKKGVKGIFVIASKNSLVLVNSSTNIDSQLISNAFSRLNLQALKQSGFGKIKSGVFQFSDVVLNFHILEDKFHQPIILMFVCDYNNVLMKNIEKCLPAFKKKLSVLFG